MASDTSSAASNMDSALQRLGTPSLALRCFSRPMTAWVPARLPELNSTKTRSPARSNTLILQKLAKLSTPAWVRESDARTNPASSMMPTQ
jgi:hypothetical protein